MELPEIKEVIRFDDKRISQREREHFYAVTNLGNQYSSSGCSCATFLGATTSNGCCYGG